MYKRTEPALGGLSQSAGCHMETPGPRGHGAGAPTDAAGEKLPPATPPPSTGATKRSELEAETITKKEKARGAALWGVQALVVPSIHPHSLGYLWWVNSQICRHRRRSERSEERPGRGRRPGVNRCYIIVN